MLSVWMHIHHLQFTTGRCNNDDDDDDDADSLEY